MTPAKDDELSARIDAELRRALTATPSPEFLPRVRARVAKSATPRLGLIWWLVPAAAVGAGALALALRPGERAAVQPPAATQAVASSVAPGALQAPSARKAPATRQAPGTRSHAAPGTRHRAPARTLAAREPEVLLPRDEAIAFERLVTRLAHWRIDADAWVSDAGLADPRARITIAPIDIRPLTLDR